MRYRYQNLKPRRLEKPATRLQRIERTVRLKVAKLLERAAYAIDRPCRTKGGWVSENWFDTYVKFASAVSPTAGRLLSGAGNASEKE